jgi:hypothetical protein
MPPPEHKFFEHHKEVWSRIEESALACGLSETEAFDVAFHMLDWHNNLADLISFLEHPESLTNEGLEEMLSAFLTHAPNHIAAAAKLYNGEGLKDIFGVGICEDDIERVGD